MESSISCIGEPAKFKVNLCQDRYYIKDSFGKNPIAVSLANNHIMGLWRRGGLKGL